MKKYLCCILVMCMCVGCGSGSGSDTEVYVDISEEVYGEVVIEQESIEQEQIEQESIEQESTETSFTFNGVSYDEFRITIEGLGYSLDGTVQQFLDNDWEITTQIMGTEVEFVDTLEVGGIRSLYLEKEGIDRPICVVVLNNSEVEQSIYDCEIYRITVGVDDYALLSTRSDDYKDLYGSLLGVTTFLDNITDYTYPDFDIVGFYPGMSNEEWSAVIEQYIAEDTYQKSEEDAEWTQYLEDVVAERGSYIKWYGTSSSLDNWPFLNCYIVLGDYVYDMNFVLHLDAGVGAGEYLEELEGLAQVSVSKYKSMEDFFRQGY